MTTRVYPPFWPLIIIPPIEPWEGVVVWSIEDYDGDPQPAVTIVNYN